MSILEKHVKTDYKSALLEEIELLATSEGLDRKSMNVDKFDPTSEKYCFIAQLFGGQQPTYAGDSHRDFVGRMPREERMYRHNGTMTPLEIWSAENWGKNKDSVIKVFHYIKSGGKTELPEITFE